MFNEEPLSLKHRSILDPLWKSLSTHCHLLFAEYSFANNYLFREWHSYTFIDSKKPMVKGIFSNGKPYLIPTFPPEDFVEHAIPVMEELNACLFPIPNEWLKFLPHHLFSFSNSPDESDYVFAKDKMASLAGRALSSRRNLIYQLERNYEVRSEKLSSENLPLTLEILQHWHDDNQATDSENDFIPCKEAIEKFETFNFFGRIAFADEKPVAFSIGEFMNNTKALLHFAKSYKEIKGITPFLYRDFATHLPSHIEWINLEQDLGKISLRNAKQAYHPAAIVEKWHVSLVRKPLIEAHIDD